MGMCKEQRPFITRRVTLPLTRGVILNSRSAAVYIDLGSRILQPGDVGTVKNGDFGHHQIKDILLS